MSDRKKVDANFNDMSEFPVEHLNLLGKVSAEYGQDPESMSICPLLTPSPTGQEYQSVDPLAQAMGQKQLLLEGKSPSPDFNQDEETALLAASPPSSYSHPLDPLRGLTFERRATSSSIDSKMIGEISNQSCAPEVPYTELGGTSENCFHTDRSKYQGELLKSSESPDNVTLHEHSTGPQLLASDFDHLEEGKMKEMGKFICQHPGQDKGKNHPAELTGRRPPPDFAFISWNWPLIRKSCFWTIVSSIVACFCVLVAMLAMVPQRCYPPHPWYHGSVFYEIFPASYQDSNGDGLGDLRGIASRAGYLSKIGVRAIRLNSIFPASHYPEAFGHVTNLTDIEKSLGDFNDFEHLVTTIKKRNISLVLDLPIYPYVKNLGELKVSVIRKNVADKITSMVQNHRSHRSPVNESYLPPELVRREFGSRKRYLKPYIDGGIAGLMKSTSDHLNSISQSIVEEAIEYWFQNGVDGLYLKGLEHYVADPKFLLELDKWRALKETFRHEGKEKMLMCDYKLLNAVEDDEQALALIGTMDLLDVYLDVSNGTTRIKEQVTKYQKGRIFDKRTYPWIHWNIGGVDTRTRLAGRVENNLGAILFQFLLPGTISIFYGDEIGLMETHDPHLDHRDVAHVHHLAPMKWQPNGTGFTRHDALPWLPYAKSARTTDVHEQILSNMARVRGDAPSIYMNSIWKDEESLSNWSFRYMDDNLIVLERSYPRRNAYVVVYNAGADEARNDLSSIYYRGQLVEDSRGRTGMFMRFNDLKLGSGEAFVVKLDK